MNNLHYRHFQDFEKRNLENILKNKSVAKAIYGSTENGWTITKYKWLVNISELSRCLKRTRTSIKNELQRGLVFKQVQNVKLETNEYLYSKFVSSNFHKNIILKRRKLNLKINRFIKLRNWISENVKLKHSLKSIAGRSKIVFVENIIDATISHQTLYNYINNENIDFIDNKCLFRKQKHKYRISYKSKRQNGISIDERPNNINLRNEFGHWEGDLVLGTHKSHLLTLIERQSRLLKIIKIPNKTSLAVVKAFRNLQDKDELNYCKNIKSITFDNGPEFWSWHEISKSIYGVQNNINVYFTHPYSSWEKGSIENANSLIRRHFPKKTNFDLISEDEISLIEIKINSLFREKHMYKTSNEVYNNLINLGW